jgi:hypothetical protein
MQKQVIDEIFEDLDKVRSSLFDAVEMLPDNAFEPRFDKKWNAPKILGHLNKFETLVLDFFKTHIFDFSKNVTVGWNAKRLSDNWKNALNDYTAKYESPEIMRANGISKNDYKEIFEKTRRQLKTTVYKKLGKDFNKIIIAHPNGSKLNLIQWLELMGVHEKRHIRQLEHLSF